MARRLDDREVVKTLARLHARIGQRFPDSGLQAVCAELVESARTISARARRLGRPYVLPWMLVLIAVSGAIGFAIWLAALGLVSRLDGSGANVFTLAQALESTVNLVVVAGAAVWFLLGLEARMKRARAMRTLHELRSFAHVVDMHQLTKDPTMILGAGRTTSASPVRTMSEFELTRYLEYCAEMLALIGKLAALYAEYTRDEQVVSAVNDVETLCTDLGRKIWQKITILSRLDEARA